MCYQINSSSSSSYVFVCERSIKSHTEVLGEKSCTSTSPASVTFSFLAACLLSRWKQVATVAQLPVVKVLVQVFDIKRQYSQGVKRSLIVKQGSSHQHIQTSATQFVGGHWCIRWRTTAQVRILGEDRSSTYAFGWLGCRGIHDIFAG